MSIWYICGTNGAITMCACAKTSFRTLTSFPYAVFCVGGTQWVILSAANAKSRVGNAREGPKRRLCHARDGRRRHAGGIASEYRKHPKHEFRC